MLSKTLLLPFFAATSSFISSVAADLDEYKSPNGTTIWDEAPNFKNDPIQPYPDLKGPNGEDLTIENLRGVHLFGYKGCSGQESVWIKEAYSDFYKLAQQPELYNNIDWSDEVRDILSIIIRQFAELSKTPPGHETWSHRLTIGVLFRLSRNSSAQIATPTRYLQIHEQKYNVSEEG